jgi:indolepyruvate ferredoxin oxidoreductase beta subunit
MNADGKGINIVLGGRGGQGILFASTLLEQAAVDLGLDVIGSETHGMAQRGGSVVSHLKVGGAKGPLVASGEADLLVSLEKTETYRTLPFLRAGGTCFTNVPEGDALDGRVTDYASSRSIPLFRLDADAVARACKAPQATNVAMLGLLASWPDSPFSRETLAGIIRTRGAERFREVNLEVFEKGYAEGRRVNFTG